jgi:hypothetical protein
MKAKKPLLLVVLLAFVLALAFAPAALAKSQPVAASGDWTWVGNPDGTDRLLPSGQEFFKGSETGQWTGTFAASDAYEPYVAMFTKLGDLRGKLWINFADATVDMGGGKFLHGDMTMLVVFHAATWEDVATWKIESGTGGLKHLGGQGTLVWTETGMHYTGTVWTQK